MSPRSSPKDGVNEFDILCIPASEILLKLWTRGKTIPLIRGRHIEIGKMLKITTSYIAPNFFVNLSNLTECRG